MIREKQDLLDTDPGEDDYADVETVDGKPAVSVKDVVQETADEIGIDVGKSKVGFSNYGGGGGGVISYVVALFQELSHLNVVGRVH